MIVPASLRWREAVSEIVAIARVEPHALGVAPSQDAEAIVLDFMNPVWARRRLFGWAGKARLEGKAAVDAVTQCWHGHSDSPDGSRTRVRPDHALR
jgi:hypothetical protein